jgi:hypothetical protein
MGGAVAVGGTVAVGKGLAAGIGATVGNGVGKLMCSAMPPSVQAVTTKKRLATSIMPTMRIFAPGHHSPTLDSQVEFFNP